MRQKRRDCLSRVPTGAPQPGPAPRPGIAPAAGRHPTHTGAPVRASPSQQRAPWGARRMGCKRLLKTAPPFPRKPGTRQTRPRPHRRGHAAPPAGPPVGPRGRDQEREGQGRRGAVTVTRRSNWLRATAQRANGTTAGRRKATREGAGGKTARAAVTRAVSSVADTAGEEAPLTVTPITGRLRAHSPRNVRDPQEGDWKLRPPEGQGSALARTNERVRRPPGGRGGGGRGQALQELTLPGVYTV